MSECRHYKTYKAQKPPKCGCTSCEQKWLQSENERLKARVAELEDAFKDMHTCVYMVDHIDAGAWRDNADKLYEKITGDNLRKEQDHDK